MFDETVYSSVEETVNHGANMVSESAEAALQSTPRLANGPKDA